jgi:TDG/mug DNA glycosylase family protein
VIVDTLPDFFGDKVEVMSIGLNPSLPSVRAGYPFANPRNRFWRALNDSRMFAVDLPPSVESTRWLADVAGIGFTDVVKRPTAGSAELLGSDYAFWAPVLAQKIARFRPRVAWFHGKVAFQKFRRHGMERSPASCEWGEQPETVGNTRLFVTPNPSSANATFSLDDLIEWFARLGEVRARLG